MTNRPTREEELQEQYEDALFALMMHKYAEKMGEELLAENERLKNDPSAAVPEELQRRNLELIRTYTSNGRKEKKSFHIGRILGRVAIAAVLASTLFCSALALSPDLRAGILNLRVKVSDSAVSMQLGPEHSKAEKPTAPMVTLSWIPDGYLLGVPTQGDLRTTIVLEDTNGNSIQVSAFADAYTTQSIDVEDVDYYEEVTVQGCPAFLIKKDGLTRISWVDGEGKVFLYVSSAYESDENLLRIAENIKLEQ